MGDFLALQADKHQLVDGVPRCRPHLGIDTEGFLSVRGRVVVVKIIEHLFNAHGIFGRALAIVYKPAHIAVGGGIHIYGKGGQRYLQGIMKNIVVDGGILFGIPGWVILTIVSLAHQSYTTVIKSRRFAFGCRLFHRFNRYRQRVQLDGNNQLFGYLDRGLVVTRSLYHQGLTGQYGNTKSTVLGRTGGQLGFFYLNPGPGHGLAAAGIDYQALHIGGRHYAQRGAGDQESQNYQLFHLFVGLLQPYNAGAYHFP